MSRILIVIALLCLPFSSALQAFVIDVDSLHQDTPAGKGIEQFFIAVYAQLKIVPTFMYYPPKRGLRMVNKGELDAEATRFEIVASQYPNFVRVNEALLDLHVGLFCFNDPVCQPKSDSAIVVLKGMESGARLCRQKSYRCRYESNISTVTRLLETGIATALLSTTSTARIVVCNSENTDISYTNIPEFRQQSFHYVNKKHTALVPKLEQAIREVRKQSQFEQPSQTLEQTLTYDCGVTVNIAASSAN